MISEIKKEQLVVSWLKNHGYYRVEKKGNEDILIEADGKMRRMIVAVICGHSIQTEKKENIIKIAHSSRREAWLAEVESTDNTINWSLLE